LQEHFKDKALTEDSAREWARSLVTNKRSAYTVATNWLSAARTLYTWAKEQRLVAANPFKEVRIKIPEKILLRESKAFTADEAKKILSAALAINPKSTFQFAQRWCVWLAAYSGARMGEICQLRGQDIEKRGEFWVMKLTPEAGPIKTKKTRVVPLHEHVIEQGFLEFIAKRGKGALFYNRDEDNGDDDPTNPRRPRSVKVRERLGQWIRAIGVKDRELQPNHAWRHTFKQIAERHGISERVSDAITGHAAATVGRAYGAPTVEDMARELVKFPRYMV
jgi:integrase